MELLIISATPKTEGITYSFVKQAETTATELSASFETIRLSDLGIAKCKMCNDGWGICFGQHRCAFGDSDGFNELQEKMQAASAYIYISPVYWGEVSEEMKVFLDKFRRCQATKQWDSRVQEVSFLKDKPSIVVAVAGGGGGGIISSFENMERIINHMDGDSWSRETTGIFDWIAVNRWNQDYKRDAFASALTRLIQINSMPRPMAVKALPEYRLEVEFDGGESRIFDMAGYIEMPKYAELKDVALFNNVSLANFWVQWRPQLHVAVEVLYASV